MGARIVLCDPHRAVISGPSPLKGGTVESPDIRAGMAMLLAALAAEGASTIHNVGQIERGYERIDERLRALGADIERADGCGARLTDTARGRPAPGRFHLRARGAGAGTAWSRASPAGGPTRAVASISACGATRPSAKR